MLKVMPVGFVCFDFSKKREVAPINKAGKDEKHFFLLGLNFFFTAYIISSRVTPRLFKFVSSVSNRKYEKEILK